MKLFQKRDTSVESADFALLRARLEVGVPRPAIITMTSSTAKDGKEVAARALACSLATTGYSTLLVDTLITGRGPATPPQGLDFEEIMRRQVTCDSRTGNLVVLTLSDATMQGTTNQRGVESAIEIARSKFDYVVISAECGLSSSFATALVAVADAVLVSVRLGRRQTAEDARLADILERSGPRFIGVVALDSSIISGHRVVDPVPEVIFNGFRSQAAHVDQEHQRRGIA